jgi:hypothetical protein
VVRLLADENFNGRVVGGIRRRAPHVDIVRVQDVGFSGHSDPEILRWAASEDRIDAQTVARFAYERADAGLSMPGVVEVKLNYPVAEAIDDLILLVECSLGGEWEGQVLYLPL